MHNHHARQAEQTASPPASAPSVNFIIVLRAAFAPVDPESVKNTVKSYVSSYAFGICGRKSCM